MPRFDEKDDFRRDPSKRDPYKRRHPSGSRGMGFLGGEIDEVLDADGKQSTEKKTKRIPRGPYGRVSQLRVNRVEKALNIQRDESSETQKPSRVTELIEERDADAKQQLDIPDFKLIQYAIQEEEKAKKNAVEALQRAEDKNFTLDRAKFQTQVAAMIKPAVDEAPSLNETDKAKEGTIVRGDIIQTKAVGALGSEPIPAEADKTAPQAEPIKKTPSFEHLDLDQVKKALAEASVLVDRNEQELSRLTLEEQKYEEKKRQITMAFGSGLKEGAFRVSDHEQAARKEEIENTKGDLERLRAAITRLKTRQEELTQNIPPKLDELSKEIVSPAYGKSMFLMMVKDLLQEWVRLGVITAEAANRKMESAKGVNKSFGRALSKLRSSLGIEQSKPIETKEESLSEQIQKEFGLTPENLQELGFETLEEPQQALVLENLRQLVLGRIQEEAEDAYDENISSIAVPSGWGSLLQAETYKKSAKKLWLGFFKSAEIASLEKKKAQDFRVGGLDMHGETVRRLIEIVKTGPNVSFDKEGNIQMDFLDVSGLEFSGDQNRNNELIQNFQVAAKQLASIPREWSYPEANQEEKDVYQRAKQVFEEKKCELLGLTFVEMGESKDSQLSQSEEFFQRLNTAEYHIEMERFFNQYPDADQAIIDMANQSVVTGFFKKVKSNLQMGKSTEATAQFTLGYLGRSAAAYISAGAASASLIAFPLVGGIMGGWNGWRRAKANLEKQDKQQRMKGNSKELEVIEFRIQENRAKMKALEAKIHSLNDARVEVDASVKAEYVKCVQEYNVLKAEQEKKGAKNILKSYRAEERLEELMALYDSTENEKKKAQVKAQIQSRIKYTRKKLEDGLISFDGKTVDEAKKWEGADAQVIRMGQQMRLLNMLAKAEAYATFNENYMMSAEAPLSGDSEDWATRSNRRLGKVLAEKEQEINDARKKYKKEMVKKGALMGLGFALTGAALREAVANGFFDWSHNNNVTQHLDSVVVPQTPSSPDSSEMIPAHIDIRIPFDVQHISGKSIEGEMIKQLVHDQGISTAEAGKLAHRAVLAFAEEHHLSVSQLHQLNHIRSADLDMRIVDGRPEILSLETIPTRGHEAIHIARTALPPTTHLPEAEQVTAQASEPIPDVDVSTQTSAGTIEGARNIIHPDVSDLQNTVIEDISSSEMTRPETYTQTFRGILDSIFVGSTLPKPEIVNALRETSSVDNEMIEKTFGKNFDGALLALGATLAGMGYSFLRFRRKKSLEQVIDGVSRVVAQETDLKKREKIVQVVNAFEDTIRKGKVSQSGLKFSEKRKREREKKQEEKQRRGEKQEKRVPGKTKKQNKRKKR